MGIAAGTGAAAADELTPEHTGGAAATLDGLGVHGEAVLHAEGDDGRPKDQPLDAGLFEMNVDGGGKLMTYCVDIGDPVQDEAKYLETPWAQTTLGGNRNAGKILWILDHSYPQVDDLAALAGAARTGTLTPETAAAGTQVAIWRLSDHADVDASDPGAERLAAWLGRNARTLAEPRASLSLGPTAVSGTAGERVGPVTVSTGAGSVAVVPPADAAATGVKITDKDGTPVTTARNGTRLYVETPAGSDAGTARFGVQATTSVPVGRAFSGVNKSQTQILAGSSESTVSATATGTWAKEGPFAALTVGKDCEKGGVDVKAANQGDDVFSFDLAGEKHLVPARATRTVTVPVAEDQKYDFTVKGAGAFEQHFSGTLDCLTLSMAPKVDQDISNLSAASAGGPTGGSTDAVDDLAETGSSSATPIIAGVAIGLLVIGGGALFLLRGKKGPGAAA